MVICRQGDLRVLWKDHAAHSIAPEEREPWHSRGVLKISAKNFYICYRPDEVSGRVYVLNVIYEKCDQLKALNKMNFYD